MSRSLVVLVNQEGTPGFVIDRDGLPAVVDLLSNTLRQLEVDRMLGPLRRRQREG